MPIEFNFTINLIDVLLLLFIIINYTAMDTKSRGGIGIETAMDAP
jgi:hypothetical protein